jgi:cell division transport system ATP-binding protein
MIQFDNVTKAYRKDTVPAIEDVSLKINSKEFVFLVGASGSGKSTFLNLVLKNENLTFGTIHVLGRNISKLSNRKIPFYRRKIGSVFQDFKLLENKTVFDNVAFAMQIIGISKHQIMLDVPKILKLVKLDGFEKRLPHQLSGGEQQRVAIARAIANKPPILLADEPTGNLDPTTSVEIMKTLFRIHKIGTTVVMATHDMHMVDRAKQRVIELDKGHIIRDEEDASYTKVLEPIK